MNNVTRNILTYSGLALVLAYIIVLFCLPDTQDSVVCNQVVIEIKDSADRQFIKPREIERILKEASLYPLGKTYAEINTQVTEDCIAKQPYLRNVECHKSHEGVVHIVAEQRKPRFRVLGDENYYVDEDGKIMPVGTTTAYYVPLFTGRVSRRMAQNELVEFVDFLEDNPFWNAQIRQIHINERQEVEIVPTVGNSLILLGKWNEYERKLNKLERFYEELNKMGWQDWREIDLRYRGQVVCR